MSLILFNDYIKSKRSLSTKKGCEGFLRRFFIWINDGELIEDCNEFSREYLTSERDYFDDISCYLNYLLDLGQAPKTINNSLTFIRHWLSWNGFILTPLQDSIIKSRMPRVVSIRDEDIFDTEKIKSILSHSDIFLRALILVLCSSGMRVNEALSLKFEQIHGNELHMTASQMKAGKPHIYFISAEAHQALDEWVKVRDDAIKQAVNKNSKCFRNSVVYDTVFLYTYHNARQKFLNALKKAQLFEKDSVINWSRLTFHGFRKWTDSTMKIHISSNLANSLIGHFESGDSSYMRYTLEQRRKAYAEVEPFLTVLAPPDYAENKNEIKSELMSQSKLVIGLAEKNFEFERELRELKMFIMAAEK